MGFINRVFGRETAGGASSDEAQIALAMIALPSLEWFDPVALESNFGRMFRIGHRLEHIQSDDTSMLFQLGDHNIFISLVPVPIPLTDLEQSYEMSRMSPEEKERMRG